MITQQYFTATNGELIKRRYVGWALHISQPSADTRNKFSIQLGWTFLIYTFEQLARPGVVFIMSGLHPAKPLRQ